MASIKLRGDTSGELVIEAPAVAGTNTLTLPAATANILTDTSSLPAANLTGSLPAIDGSSLTGVPSLGVGQTWTNVTASRAIATQYTNTTGNPILVVISCTGNGPNGLFGAMVDGSTIMFSPSTASSGYWTSVSFVVPNGSTYNTNQQGANVTLGLWWELR